MSLHPIFRSILEPFAPKYAPKSVYICVYCGRECCSPNGTGSDVVCCGERGHAELKESDDE